MPALTQRSHKPRMAAPSRLQPLRIATFLAPSLFWFYEFVSHYLGDKLDRPVVLAAGSRYEDPSEEADLAFLCGLAYVELADGDFAFEPLAAPVLRGPRYQGKPIYYSDVVVRRRSSFSSFADLRGRSWAYNEPHSQSGCGVIRYHLAQLGETRGYFSRVVQSGWHERSIHMVCSGEVDASAIDSHVLAVEMRRCPELATQLRIIASLGPSTIQPLVAARRLPQRTKVELQSALRGMNEDAAACRQLQRVGVARFVAVNDARYDDIRRMREAAAGVASM